MDNIYVWMTFFGAPLLLLAISAFIYRPSARDEYREAKMIPFAEPGEEQNRTHRS